MRTTLFTLFLLPALATAEPFLAVENGFHCSQCHVNPTGGGLRNAFGSAFSQSQLPANVADAAMDVPGLVGDRLLLGADIRGSARQADIDTVDDNFGFGVDSAAVYLSATLNESATLYLDEQVAPGGALAREVWAKFQFGNTYLKAGRIFLPWGLRIEDDSANIRRYTNINFDTPDNGIEIGRVAGPWSLQLALSNGTGGAAEIDDGKQASLRLAWVGAGGRLGLSANRNDSDAVERTMYGLFAGLRTGPVSWLLEIDRIEDDPATLVETDQDLAFIEANWKLARGNYLKFGFESRSHSGSAFMDSSRYVVEYQWYPVAFAHLRAGLRMNDNDDPAPVLNADEAFVQLHVFF